MGEQDALAQANMWQEIADQSKVEARQGTNSMIFAIMQLHVDISLNIHTHTCPPPPVSHVHVQVLQVPEMLQRGRYRAVSMH